MAINLDGALTSSLHIQELNKNMPISTSTVVHVGAIVPDSVNLGDFVSVHAGALLAENCTIHGFTQIWSGTKIGENTCFDTGVSLERPDDKKNLGISFGANCEIGAGSVIRQGLSIGEGAIVRPGSVIEQNVPPYAIVSGVPARVLGYRESQLESSANFAFPKANFPAKESVESLGVGGVTLHTLKKVCDPRGDLSVGDFAKNIPFDPKRYFLVFNVPSEKTRGEHAHYECHQFLICVKGSCAVVADDGLSRREVLLSSPEMGIYLPPMTWGIQYKYSNDAVLLVFASHYYDSADYIRDYSEFVEAVRRQGR
jgi:acetyltransferase-like isoleucine patch superfamily enzyme/dTDP-4-dehydrorhamnose 3,5-epimerase-like enzyme